jgi:DNA-binding beta-propeller fold protein YncE
VKRLCCCVVLAVLVGALPARADDWAQHGPGPANDGHVSGPGLISPEDAAHLGQVWAGIGDAGVATSGELVLAVARDFRLPPEDGEEPRTDLRAYWRDSGVLAWRAEVSHGHPIVHRGILYVPGDHVVLAFDGLCGEGERFCSPLWSLRLPEQAEAITAVGDEIFVTGFERVFAFPAICPQTSCYPEWQIDSGAGPGVVSDGTQLIRADTSLRGFPLHCESRGALCDDGWTIPMPEPSAGMPPAVADGKAFVAGNAGTLMAYSLSCRPPADCPPLWHSVERVTGTPAVAGGLVYAPSGARLLVFPADCGSGNAECEPLWTAEAPRDAFFLGDLSRPTVAGSVVYVTRTDGRLLAFDARCPQASCGPVADLPLGNDLDNFELVRPSVSGGRVFVGTGADLLAFSAGATPPSGALSQVPGRNGCVTRLGRGDCTADPRLRTLAGLAVSPDGRNVYSTRGFSSGPRQSVLTLRRNAETGALSPLRSHAVDGTPLRGAPSSVQVSPDGRNVYAGGFDAAILSFRRNPRTGALRPLKGRDGCFGDLPGCRTYTVMTRGGVLLSVIRVEDLAIPVDGRDAYFAGPNGALHGLRRDRRSGALRQIRGRDACYSDPAAAQHLQTGEPRKLGRIPCRQVRGVGYVVHAAVSPDGSFVYAATLTDRGPAVMAFSRNARTGALRRVEGRAGCSEMGAPEDSGPCRRIPRELGYPNHARVSVSPDGRAAYLTVGDEPDTGHLIAALARNPETGGLRPALWPRGCIGGFPVGKCRFTIASLLSGPVFDRSGKTAYVVGGGASGDVSGVIPVTRVRRGRLVPLRGQWACVAARNPICGAGRGMGENFRGYSVAASGDGRHVYVAGGSGIAAFTRAP